MVDIASHFLEIGFSIIIRRSSLGRYVSLLQLQPTAYNWAFFLSSIAADESKLSEQAANW
jgi:hypothetical protein